jgi:hypothetical protein
MIDIPAMHSMEYIYTVIANKIIQDLKASGLNSITKSISLAYLFSSKTERPFL